MKMHLNDQNIANMLKINIFNIRDATSKRKIHKATLAGGRGRQSKPKVMSKYHLTKYLPLPL